MVEVQSEKRPRILQTRTSFLWQKVEEDMSAFPGLALVFRHHGEMLCAVAAFPHGLAEALVDVGLVAVVVELVVLEFYVHGRVGEGHIVENDF